jgi:hypothetical protein
MTLYNQDYCKWVNTQTAFLKVGDFSNLDVAFLIEELDDLGGSIKRALESHYRVLFCHLLKKQFQPEMATRSWDLSIKNAMNEIKKILRKNPSLKSHLPEIKQEAYSSAKIWASAETFIEEEVFPETCQFTDDIENIY